MATKKRKYIAIQDEQEIARLLKDTRDTYRSIGERFGVSRQSIWTYAKRCNLLGLRAKPMNGAGVNQ
jgi:hypothetical protein